MITMDCICIALIQCSNHYLTLPLCVAPTQVDMDVFFPQNHISRQECNYHCTKLITLCVCCISRCGHNSVGLSYQIVFVTVASLECRMETEILWSVALGYNAFSYRQCAICFSDNGTLGHSYALSRNFKTLQNVTCTQLLCVHAEGSDE